MRYTLEIKVQYEKEILLSCHQMPFNKIEQYIRSLPTDLRVYAQSTNIRHPHFQNTHHSNNRYVVNHFLGNHTSHIIRTNPIVPTHHRHTHYHCNSPPPREPNSPCSNHLQTTPPPLQALVSTSAPPYSTFPTATLHLHTTSIPNPPFPPFLLLPSPSAARVITIF